MFLAQEEMASCALPMLDSTTAEDLKPHTAHALRHVPLLPPILDRVPPPVLWPTSAGVPQVLGCFLFSFGIFFGHLLALISMVKHSMEVQLNTQQCCSAAPEICWLGTRKLPEADMPQRCS